MSSSHTKTISRILDPVAQQVLKLILLFEDGGTAGDTPDLANRVSVVKMAVDNLVKVGYETICQSLDQLFKHDMPPALVRVEEASVFLQDAVKLLSRDPSSTIGRKKLIDGSRGILQGTWSVLVAFDMSEVRKIVDCCNSVLTMLNTVPNIKSFPELADFVKNLTPGMSQMIREVDERQDELVIRSHAEILQRGIAQVKRITPILISSIKLYLNTTQQRLPAACEAQSNRDYFLRQMSDEICEIIRGLQLTSSDDTDYLGDYNGLRLLVRNSKFADEWLLNPAVNVNGAEFIQGILDTARHFEAFCMSDSERMGLHGLISGIDSCLHQLLDAQQRGDAATTQSAAACRGDLARLLELCRALCERMEHQNAIYRLARTLEGKATQARRWLLEPRGPQRQVGYEATRALLAQALQIIQTEAEEEGFQDPDFQESCNRLRSKTDELYALLEKPLVSEVQRVREQKLATEAVQTLDFVWHNMQHGLVRQVANFFTDLIGPIRNLQEATSAVPANATAYQQAADNFLEHSRRVKRTASLAASNLVDPWRGSALQALASNLESVGSQVSMAGWAVMSARQNGASAQLQNAASDHFNLIKRHWTECAERTRNLVDEAIDAKAFIKAQETGILRDIDQIEDSADQHCPTSVVNGTTSIALRANRVLQVAMRETENSEDGVYVDRVNEAVHKLRATITTMVADAKNMVLAMDDLSVRERWRASSRNLVDAVSGVGQVVEPTYLHLAGGNIGPAFQRNNLRNKEASVTDVIPVAEMRQLYIQGGASSSLSDDNSRPLSPETDLEDEFNYPLPEKNQPIMAAAHALHQEARLWSSRDNELIAATKRIAALMAKLSQIVRGEHGNKKDLISVSMAIAEASVDVTRCARALGRDCTDRRMKTSLLQLSERIQMIGNQLKILSTVKATMLGSDDSPEDRENTEVLVGNAQNLMQAVIETVRRLQDSLDATAHLHSQSQLHDPLKRLLLVLSPSPLPRISHPTISRLCKASPSVLPSPTSVFPCPPALDNFPLQ
ncbi:Vinculin [Echinococcus granulosus]|nr:Vinculin [Echinococcus granulosus]